jgi:2-polyprenyl-6-methoxyphenol hydroxylase-like FAD-dependent oxidoreductase
LAEKNHVDPEVLIVGAGPAGLVLACDLARRNVRFRLVEARGTPADASLGSRGKGIQPRTMEIYDDLGIVDQFFAVGGPYFPGMVWRGRQQIGETRLPRVEPRPASVEVPYPSTWMVPQPQALSLLEARLHELGGEVEYGVQVVSMAQDAERVQVQLRLADGSLSSCDCRYLVGADGARGITRASLDVEFVSEIIDAHPMLTADVVVDGLPRTHWHMWNEAEGGALWLLPLPRSQAFQLYARCQSGQPETSDAAVRRMVLDRTGFVAGEIHWASAFGIRIGMARRFKIERCFLIGDAAHVHPPAGGQGMNTSVQDAYNLGWKLGQVLRFGAPEALLDSYEAERVAVAAKLLNFVGEIYKSWVGHEQKPSAADEDGDNLQLSLNYRGGPLAVAARADTADLQPGDRVPDAVLRRHTGQAIRLFDLLRGPHLTLLALGGSELPGLHDAQAAAVRGHRIATSGLVVRGHEEVIQDPYGMLLKRFGAGLTLVRPDGYLALAGASEEEVRRYLALCCAEPAPAINEEQA